LKKSMQDKLMKFHVSLPPSLPSSLPTTDSMYSALSPSLPVCIHTSCIPPPCILPGTPVRHTSLPESLLTSLLSIPSSLSLFTPYLTPDKVTLDEWLPLMLFWSQWWGGMMAGMEGGRHEISSICLAWTFSMCCTTQRRN
jgi:hypothetical protein